MDDNRTTAQERLLRARAVFELALLAIGVALLWGVLPHRVHGDGYVRYVALSDLLLRGRASPMRYSFVQPLFASPVWALGLIWKGSGWWCARFNVVAFAVGLLVCHRLLRPHVETSVGRRFLLIMLAGSMFPGHLRDFHGEVLTAVVVACGLLAVVNGRVRVGWTAVVVGVVNTPASLVGLGIAAGRQAVQHRRLRVFAVLAAAAVLISTESWLRRGSPFATGYGQDAGYRTLMPYSGRPGFSYPFFFGLLSILFSFGKGLVFFAPGLLLAVRGRLRRGNGTLWEAYVLWLCFLAGLVLAYSKWWSWYGGWFWGPRFFLFASVPASFALAMRLSDPDDSLWTNLWVIAVAALSFWVGLNGAVFFLDNLGVCQAEGYAFEHLCWYVPEFSVLWRPFVASRPITGKEWVLIVYTAVVFLAVTAPTLSRMGHQAINATRSAIRYVKPGYWRW